MSTINKKIEFQDHLYQEWLVTNGIGGYACGSISGVPMRRYHSFLNAALPTPYGRTNMCNYVEDQLIIKGKRLPLSYIQHDEARSELSHHLKEFRLENGIPIWRYEYEGIVLEKSLFLIHHQNTACLSYHLIQSSDTATLIWRPFLHFRQNEQPVDQNIPQEAYAVSMQNYHYEILCPDFPPLRIFNSKSPIFTNEVSTFNRVYYEIEAHRGYASIGALKSPGFFSLDLEPMERTSFIISTEAWETIGALSSQEALGLEKRRKKNLLKIAGPRAKEDSYAKLVLAADQFLMTPTTRFKEMVRLKAAGEEVKSIIAGFPWFTDWGRDTMIAFEGLTLSTGRTSEASTILHTFAHYVRDGLIPNMFPEGETTGIYNTADASLWFFHAIDRYCELTEDSDMIEFLLPKLHDIINSHLKGTLFGIRADPEDGLLIQGQKGYALTWMDAKLGDWVVTPRRGKAVEINALWYNALRLYEKWTGKSLEITEKCYHAFNQKFWCEEKKYLYDVIEGEDGNDDALRPNQLFAISLKHPVLQQDYWEPVLEIVKRDLLTPVGLRTLSPSHKDYKAYYEHDLKARDASYHQGTVWPWLIGPYVDVWLKVHPGDTQTVKELLKGLIAHLESDCIGTIGEIFDSVPPFHARGCFAQAWSVAECLRCLKMVS